MTSIPQLCDQLLEAYQAKGLPVQQSLRPPLDAEEAERLCATAGVRLAPELSELYSWRDGASPEGDFRFAGKAFLPLAQALSRREALLAALHPRDRQGSEIADLVPFAEASPEWLALSATTQGGHRPVLEVLEDAQPGFDSLQAMLATCAAWVSEPDWTPHSPPARAQEIWYQHNQGDL